MPSKKKPEWEVRTYGAQLDDIDVDLMAQIVIMLGREMVNESAEPSDRRDESST
jgi:hypothetical protein